MKFFIFLAVAFLIFPLATAFNCNSLNSGDKDICNSIQQNLDLTAEEKDLLISDIFNPNKTSPDHDFVYMWNTNLKITSPSDGKTYSSGTIRNAWVKILTAMPSVLENGTLYVPKNGKLQTEYNYNVILPSARYKYDCKTIYSVTGQKATLNVYLNGKLIGNNKITNFDLNDKNAVFTVALNIEVSYRVKHYDDDYCEYYKSDYYTDRITLADSFNAKLYDEIPESDFKITNKYYGTTSGELIADNYTSLELTFNNASFERTNYVYSLNYSLPYYVLTLQADKVENTQIDNFRITETDNKLSFAIDNPENCRIVLSNHFESFSKNCDLEYNKSELSIKTNKLNYNENETIEVNIFPENKLVNLTYANQTIQAQSKAEFKAVLYYNKITAKYGDSESERIINVTNNKNKKLAIDLSSFGFFGYILYSFLKKYSFNLI